MLIIFTSYQYLIRNLYINRIPCGKINDINIHKNSTYFSLSYTIASFISDTIKDINLKNYDINEFKKALEHISNTKLYFALLRCFHHNPKNRHYLYI